MTEYQPDFSEVSDNYKQFVEKFKPKKTTDDCYTPEPVFRVVQDYVVQRYGVDPSEIVRPFWPDCDYQKTEYPAGCCVVDNPPFSILSRIVNWYMLHGVRFFLFAPALTVFTGNVRATAICASAQVVYENGASVNTSFLTNLEDPDIAARSDPALHDAVQRASDEVQRANKKKVAKLAFPIELITAARIGYYSNNETEFVVRRSESVFVRNLDNYDKNIFGGGYLLSGKAAAERAAAERAAAERAAAERAAAERAAAERAAAERAAAERAAAERAAAERIELSPRERAILDLMDQKNTPDFRPSNPTR